MPARIIVTEGQARGLSFTLENRIIFEVGSSPEADLKLDDSEVMAIHLKIYRERDDYHIFDLSGRGFLVNDRRSLKHPLSDGDLITLGSHKLRFETAAASPPQAPPKATGNGSARVELQAIKGNDTGKVFNLQDRPMSILGRGIATDITVWDIRVSRVHCRIDERNSDYVVSDMNSSNGTWVNGVRLKTPQKLKIGDFIKLGSTVFQFDSVS
jgi:ABC transport system ATP-binding/permease protein